MILSRFVLQVVLQDGAGVDQELGLHFCVLNTRGYLRSSAMRTLALSCNHHSARLLFHYGSVPCASECTVFSC